MSTYSLQQQAFTLSMMSAEGSDTTGTPGHIELQMALKINTLMRNQKLIDLIGGWRTVWGPVIWQDTAADPPSNVADNTMFVGHNAEDNVYVVAVAGTNSLSKYDWAVEDFGVSELTFWGGSAIAMISQGTHAGLSHLLNMTDPILHKTLRAYLGTVSDRATAKLIFAGHSLGGALSPALALNLFDPLKQSGWTGGNIFVYPTAGPTPGNQGFMTLFRQAFPTQNPHGLNSMVWNSIDLVPHAWAPTTFAPEILNNLYGSNLAASPCIQYVNGMVGMALPAPNPYVQLPNRPFTGTFQEPATPFADPTCAYFAQNIFQHIVAYYRELAPDLLAEQIFAPFNPLAGGVLGGEYIMTNVLYPKIKADLSKLGGPCAS